MGYNLIFPVSVGIAVAPSPSCTWQELRATPGAVLQIASASVADLPAKAAISWSLIALLQLKIACPDTAHVTVTVAPLTPLSVGVQLVLEFAFQA